jgi:arsenical resistance protein ArsH
VQDNKTIQPTTDVPNVDSESFRIPDAAVLSQIQGKHRPRILLLYGSLRERSFSRFATEEAARLLRAFGVETKIFNPSGLPLPDDHPADHPKVKELRELSA